MTKICYPCGEKRKARGAFQKCSTEQIKEIKVKIMKKIRLKELFNIDAEIVEDPRSKKPVCITYDMVG